MPVTPSYPGLYIEEIPSNSHTITAAPTSVAVFIGYPHPFQTQAFNQPTQIFSFADYERLFGGFFSSSLFESAKGANLFDDLAMSVYQFFQNGGAQAYIVGLTAELPSSVQILEVPDNNGTPVSLLPGQAAQSVGPNAHFAALQVVDELYSLQIILENIVAGAPSPMTSPLTADLIITYTPLGSMSAPGAQPVTEVYPRVNFEPQMPNQPPAPNSVLSRINGVSNLVQVYLDPTASTPLFPEDFLNNNSPPSPLPSTVTFTFTSPLPLAKQVANLGQIFDYGDFIKALQADSPLDKLAIFNLLVIPGVTNAGVLSAASSFCLTKRAFLIMDPPRQDTPDGIGGTLILNDFTTKSKNSALYFPWLQSNHPLTGDTISISPGGTVAGIFSEIDQNRGVWKAPAGLETLLTNVTDVVSNGRMTDQRQGVLNLQGVNCIRNFPNVGVVVFGSRTSVSSNPSFQEWKYVPVRRMALFLEQTLYANLGWVVFEPNSEPLWTAIRTSIESFMLGLFNQGAFQGDTPSDAFQVKCDHQTTTTDDINNGIVNIVVAFAPLQPAEFVVIQIAQMAGQTQTS